MVERTSKRRTRQSALFNFAYLDKLSVYDIMQLGENNMKKKKLEFEIKNGHLVVGDDEIYLNWVNLIGIRESAMREGEYAIHVYTPNMIEELYYTGDGDEVYDAFNELSAKICENYPVFRPMFQTELVNFRNVQEISYSGGILSNSKVKISFKRGDDLVRVASKVEYKKINADFDEYKANRKQGITI